MKSNIIILVVLLFANSSLFSQISKKAEVAHYYKQLNNKFTDVSLKLATLGNYLGEYSKIASKNENFKLDKGRYDTISSLYTETSKILNQGIFEIIELKEADSTFKINMIVLDIFGGFNKILSDSYSVFISSFQTGFKDYTQNDIAKKKEAESLLFKNLKNINTNIDKFENLLYNLRSKYELSEYEILQSP